ncbi:PAS domain S-box protein [Desulforhopalus vacuolatus]|uniref:hybrid sensor histidine kinase/response regulator n=1 Tax=Desulforhopalus vacuolatus TaxID=40414 RepID=UPI001965655D|nr:ATP-binding protein [Desulforhopalus vacuolatus]MBM9518993.1 PAS domain S-box protein [Desulforhopalus vacuolatus]
MINKEADFFASKLALNVWRYDASAINSLAGVAIELDHVQSIRLLDESSNPISSRGDTLVRENITLNRKIVYQGRQVGSLAIQFSPFDAGPIWLRTMLTAVFLIFPIMVLSILATLFILRYYLSLPLKNLLGYIQTIAQGDYGEELALKGGSEMVSIGRSIQMLSRKLQIREDYLHEQERELKKSLEKYKVLFATIPMGIIVSDPQGKILELNRYCENLVGLSREEYMSRTLGDEKWRILSPDGTPVPPEEYTAVVALRENRIVTNQDVMHLSPDGSIYWLNVRAAPIPLKEYGVVVVISDVTERKTMEENLQAYKNLVSLSNDIMLLIDKDHRYRIINNTFTAYRKKDAREFIGISVHDGTETNDPHPITRKDIDLCLQGTSFRRQQWIEYPDQGRRYMDISCLPYTDRETIHGVVVECRDITDVMQEKEEKEKLRKQLMQSQKMEAIGTLAGGIAHDFNNILTSILGYTELSLQRTGLDPTLKKHLEVVYNAGIRAKNLVRQILVFARKTEEEIYPLQIAPLASEVLKLMRSSIPSTIEIRSDINSEYLVMGNATRIHQIIMNLFTNASQAMEEDGGILQFTLDDISIDTPGDPLIIGLTPGNYVRITVSDTGQGIPPEIMDSIFEPYFTTKKQGSGTGLGLALTHSIVENHGGTIQVQSEPRRGSIFTIFLPATEELDTEELQQLASLKKGTERILFVDDEPDITSAYHHLLKQFGYTVTPMNSSLEALDTLKAAPDAFDLVISDITMPGMSGDTLTARLLEIRPDIPIILCTGFSSKLIGRTATDLGARILLHKPISGATLAATIRNILDEHLSPEA